tara:strand:+ start:3259 stop:3984 length:726 start_codon:yes stop_codon:yes gene_type:complete
MKQSDRNHKKIAIMQPYFFPYLGYFQLINEVDRFVVYDNLKYTKKGWINRNQILVGGKADVFSLPLRKDSNLLSIKERSIATEYSREKLLAKIYGNYSKAPFFIQTFEVVKKIIECPNNNLFFHVLNSIQELCDYLLLSTKIQIASDIPIDHSLRGKEKVIAVCQTLGSNLYVNPISGKNMYDRQSFIKKGIDLRFLSMNETVYQQFDNRFVPSLSIIDVLMFNSREKVLELLKTHYRLTP